jgi:S-adenosylmethionine hydrolase
MIALITDFGTSDSYVGVMKGVIASLAPTVNLIDITHHVPRGDIEFAAFQLWQVATYFPSQTVFLAVVDPGVGTLRAPLALRCGNRYFVGPDNGLFTYVVKKLELQEAVRLDRPEFFMDEISTTFHGRDIFAPAAAQIASGVPLEALGSKTALNTELPIPLLSLTEGPQVTGEITHADSFGNLITSIGALRTDESDFVLEPWLLQCPPARLPKGGLFVQLPNGARLRIQQTFGEVDTGEALAYVGSNGFLEIGVNKGYAVSSLPVQTGQQVVLAY